MVVMNFAGVPPRTRALPQELVQTQPPRQPEADVPSNQLDLSMQDAPQTPPESRMRPRSPRPYPPTQLPAHPPVQPPSQLPSGGSQADHQAAPVHPWAYARPRAHTASATPSPHPPRTYRRPPAGLAPIQTQSPSPQVPTPAHPQPHAGPSYVPSRRRDSVEAEQEAEIARLKAQLSMLSESTCSSPATPVARIHVTAGVVSDLPFFFTSCAGSLCRAEGVGYCCTGVTFSCLAVHPCLLSLSFPFHSIPPHAIHHELISQCRTRLALHHP